MPSRQLPAALPASPKKSKASGNVLDFTTESGAQTAMPVPQPSLAASVQPQRRGRPTRPESMKAAAQPLQQQQQQQQPQSQPMPKMPVPASTTGPAKPTMMQVTGEAPAQGAKLQHSVSLSRRTVSGTKPPKPVLARLQGSAFDGSSKASPSPQSSTLDAFGLSKNQSAPSPGGFGDSFGAPAPPPKDAPRDTGKRTGDAFGAATTGSGDAFGMSSKFTGQKVTSPGGFGDSFGGGFAAAGPPPPKLPKPARGFTDSFSAPPAPNKVSPASTKASPASPRKSSPRASSGQRRSQEASASPAGETSFEQRFPSLEALTGEDAKPAKSPSPPVQSPPIHPTRNRMSISMANLTGDNSRASRLSIPGQPPHPRSTHVTGTAFKGDSLKPPPTSADSPSPTADYLSMLDDEVEAPKPPEDLFSDNDESLSVALAPLQPTTSNTQSSGSRWGVSPPPAAQAGPPPPTLPKPQATPSKPLGAAQRATLPDMSAQRPTTNFNSANWSPLQSMKTPSPPNDSSDEEEAPESAEGQFRRPVSPAKSGSYNHPPSPGIARRLAAYQQHATTGPSTSPPKPGYGTWSGRSTRAARPQSMFDGSRSGSGGALSPPLVSVRSGSPGTPGSGSRTPEGTHERRGSINDMVSRYEALNTGGTSPVKEGFVNGNCRASVFGKPAPQVASKPPGLGQRKPSGPRVPRAAPATQPKPAGLRDREASGTSVDSSSGQKTGEKEKPVPKPKPGGATKPKATKPESASASTDAPPLWRASSKPDLAPKPTTLPKPKRAETLPAALEEPAQPSGSSSSRSSSPEKQQPVNLLIQRWNQGGLKNR